MPDPRDLPLARWGEQLRRERLARALRRRRAALALAAAAAGAAAGTIAWPPQRPLLLWNGSASTPRGLYLVSPPYRLRRGDMAVAWMAQPIRSFAARRHYLPTGMPVVKKVAAVGGDRVCALGGRVWVNGRRAAVRRNEDSLGRPLPWWMGCEQLAPGEAFLLGSAPGSFDGRYFGVTRSHELVGRARLIWRG